MLLQAGILLTVNVSFNVLQAADVVGYVFRFSTLKVERTGLQRLQIFREHRDYTADCELYFAPLEKHVRARTVDADIVFLKVLRQGFNVVASDRAEKECYLAVVGELAGVLEGVYEVKDFLVPFAPVVQSRKPHYGGALHGRPVCF